MRMHTEDVTVDRQSEGVTATLFGWWRTSSRDAKRSLLAASLGWMLDMFDVALYSLVLASLMADVGMSKAVGGLLGSLTLIASAVGGIAFGPIADRFGRVRAMIASILIYSVFTAACGFAQTIVQLAFFRILLGFGMGGEWASGAALVSETWPAEHRGKALAFMQSSAAFGYAGAAAVAAVILPLGGWRAVFFVGILPAIVTIWVRRQIREPDIWHRNRDLDESWRARFGEIFRRDMLRVTLALTLMNACTLFAWWGMSLWVPAYLSLPKEDGGIGLSTSGMAAMVIVMHVGMWFGYVVFGYMSDVLGRKRTFVAYLLAACASVLAYAATASVPFLVILGPVVYFFAVGPFSGFGVVTAEIYRTRVRATAQGVTYNTGRLVSALAPFTVGSLAESYGFGIAFSITAVALALGAATWALIPETKGNVLA